MNVPAAKEKLREIRVAIVTKGQILGFNDIIKGKNH
jgi:hypothetical protein